MASNEVDHRPNPTVEGEDDDPPMLSSQALEALQEFLSEQNQGSVHRDGGGSVQEDGSDERVSLIAEDWRLSQFWYDRETAETIATEVRDLCVATSSPVACVACPTLYAYLKILQDRWQLKCGHPFYGNFLGTHVSEGDSRSAIVWAPRRN